LCDSLHNSEGGFARRTPNDKIAKSPPSTFDMNDLLQEIENLIRSGHIWAARTKLAKAVRIKVPTELRCHYAALARRANVPVLGLRVLNPAVRPTGRRKVPLATPAEIAEYGASLVRLGATTEAIGLFKKLDADSLPDILLYQAFAYFVQWNYAASIPLLQRYIEHPRLTDYQRAVGKANLSAALVHENHPLSEKTLDDFEAHSKRGDYQFLYANALIIRAEHNIETKNWNEAERVLALAEQTQKTNDTLEALFIRKWKAIVQLNRKGNQRAISALDRVREGARALSHWETLRNCDYHQAVATGNWDLFHRVYFGTPHEAFRQRLRKDMGRAMELPRHYDFVLKATVSEKSSPPILIDLFSTESASRNGLKAGQAVHRLLSILSCDLYRPIRLAAIHAQLHPGEFFSPTSSPQRIHQIVMRLKRALVKNKIPLKVHESDSTYEIVPTAPCQVRIPLGRPLLNRNDLLLITLREKLGDQSFTAQTVSELLALNIWAAIRLMKHGKSTNQLELVERGAKTRYRFKAEAPSQKAAA